MKSEMINGIMLIMNLSAAWIFFQAWGKKMKKEMPGSWLQDGAAFWMWGAGELLEFAVYGAGMIRMADLILQGIAMPGDSDKSLFAVRILLAESMLFLFPLWKVLYSTYPERVRRDRVTGQEGEYGECAASAGEGGDRIFWMDGEFILGMLLLLGLTLQGWREIELVKAFACQAGYLLLFFGFEYLEERKKRKESRSIYARSGGEVPYFAGEEDAMEGRYTQRQEEYLKNIEQQYQHTRELWHDLKNHIRILEILTQEERFGELTDYLGSIKRDVEHRMVPVRTGCAAVDALLGDKLSLAGRQEVELSLQLCDLSRMRIREVDLCVILGNLLDNALEACASLPGEEEAHGQEQFVQGKPVQESSVQGESMQDMCAQRELMQEPPSQVESIRGMPVWGDPVQEPSVQVESVRGRPVQGKSMQEVSVKGEPVQEASSWGESGQGMPVQGDSVKEVSVQGKSIQEMSIQRESEREQPSQGMYVKQPLMQGAPGHKIARRKSIKLRMRQEEDFYYITVVNTSREPLREGTGYASGKRDRDNGVGHGLGLRSAERIAHRYGGLLATEYSDGEFKVVVRLQAGSSEHYQQTGR